MQEISDCSEKEIQMLGDFRCVRFNVFAKIITFLQEKLLIRNSRIL